MMRHKGVCILLCCFLVRNGLCASFLGSAENVKVVIIGAGASGYAAGCHLLERNFTDFVILEAQNRVGGRIHSIPFGNGVLNMGAEWIHGKDGNIVYQLASQFDLVYPPSNLTLNSPIYQSDGKKLSPKISNVLFEFLEETSGLDSSNYTGSQGQFYTERFWPAIQPLIDENLLTTSEAQSCLRLVELEWNSLEGAASWFETSVHTDYDASGEFDNYVWKVGGYSTVFDLLSKKIPNPNKRLKIDEKIRLGKEVTKVDWSGDRAIVRCADGSKFTADRVLTTISLNVLKATADKIFSPPLPQQNLNAITGLGMGSVAKIFLEFPYHWWDANTAMISFIWTKEDMDKLPESLKWTSGVFAMNAPDNFPLNVLCAWMIGTDAEAMESVPDDIVKRELMNLLHRFVGPQVPEALSIYRPKWFSNPFIRGAYSHRTIMSDKLNVWPKDLAASVLKNGKSILHFAGEATHPTRASTVNGAVESGIREADLILSQS